MFQTKEYDKIPEKLSEVEIGNVFNKEFKVVIIKMIKQLGRRMDEYSEKFLIKRKYKEELKR